MVVIGRECSEFIASQDGKGIECVQNHMTPFTSLVRHEQNQSHLLHWKKKTTTLGHWTVVMV